ncbi:hypothetical protein [Corynebacterium sanguinis]|uniref:Uncharacterized protein n=1 Tax=Corynebacterium sanguinis TaxID=2594913 RepID=A0A6C1TV85_9CORY|nr:hypothetical protein [Corynebacterium sanguinis]TVS26979.1 hypothetical protein EKI59_09800 [Corynebacterium sanguinis]
MKNEQLDAELRNVLEVVTTHPPKPAPGRGRSVRPGSNALRRMRLGRLVREYRTEYVERFRSQTPGRDWEALAAEMERRNLHQSARYVRDNAMAETAGLAAGAVAVSAVVDALERTVTEDRELDLLEQSVDRWADEMGVAGLEAETEREQTALTSAELLADLEQVAASEETIEAMEFAMDTPNGNPQEGIDFVLEQATAPEVTQNVVAEQEESMSV